MSSPDPLNDLTMADMASEPPSSASRRITRSQSSRRFVSPSSRRNGDEDNNPVGGKSTRRKLFQSPPSATSTPGRRLRRRTITSTVPLRESIEDESNEGKTPKPRGRPRKNNGTPMPGAGTKRRAATPIAGRTPRRPKTMAKSQEKLEESFEPSFQATPTPKRNLRARKTPSAATTSTQTRLDITPRATSARRGRRRRQALAPEELLQLADEVGDISLDTTQLPPVTSDDEVDLVRAPSESADDGPADPPQLPPVPVSNPPVAAPSSPSPVTGRPLEPEPDTWTEPVPKEPTPEAVPYTLGDPSDFSPRFGATYTSPRYTGRQDDALSRADDYDDYGDYGDLGGGGSDRSSIDELLQDDAPPTTMAPSAYDTIAQGEDFSMIFMESIQSLHPNFDSSMHPSAHDELGEETSLIINKTLESLRQVAGEGDPVDDVDVAHYPELLTIAQAAESAVEDEERRVVEEEEEEGQLPDLPVEQQESPSRNVASTQQGKRQRQRSSSPTALPGPYRSRSPHKPANPSPLRHRVLKYSAMQAEQSAMAETAQTAGFLLPPQAPTAQAAEYLEQGQENLYDDSFSEIPDAVLAAATPGSLMNMSNQVMEEQVDQYQLQNFQGDEMASEEDGESQRKGESEGKRRTEHEGMTREEQAVTERIQHGEPDMHLYELTRIATQVLMKGQNGQEIDEMEALERGGLYDAGTKMISDEQRVQEIEDDTNEDDQSREEEEAQEAVDAEAHVSEPSLFVADDEEVYQDELAERTEPEHFQSEKNLDAADSKNDDEAHNPGDYEAGENMFDVSSEGSGQDGHDAVEASRDETDDEEMENEEADAVDDRVRERYNEEQAQEREEEKIDEAEDREEVEQYVTQRKVHDRYHEELEREEEIDDREDMEEAGQYVSQRSAHRRFDEEQEREEEMNDAEDMEEVGHDAVEASRDETDDEEMENAEPDAAEYRVREQYHEEQAHEREEDMDDAEDMEEVGQYVTKQTVRGRYDEDQEREGGMDDREDMEEVGKYAVQEEVQGRYDEEQEREEEMDDAEDMEEAEKYVTQHNVQFQDNREQGRESYENVDVGRHPIIEERAAEHDMQENEDGEQALEQQDDNDQFHNDLAETMEAEAQAEEQRTNEASMASTAAASDQARLPTPDDTPPQVEPEASDQTGHEPHLSSRPPSRTRLPSRSPDRFDYNPRFTAEHSASAARSASRLASSPRYPSLVRHAPPVIQRSEEVELVDTEDEHAGTAEVKDEEMEDQVQHGEKEEEETATEEDHERAEQEVNAHAVPVEQKGVPQMEPQPEPRSEPRRSVPVEISRPSFDTTPPHQVSSPLQEPQSVQQETSQPKTARPHLTAIVRAGQVLQSITSDPPSPEGRDKQLGSPFRRSASKESWSGSRESQTSGHRLSRSPRLPRLPAATSAAAPTVPKAAAAAAAAAVQEEALTSFKTTAAQRPSAIQPVPRVAEPSSDRGTSPSRESLTSSMRITPPSEGAMSWIAREGTISPNLRGDNTLREAARLPERKAVQAPLNLHGPVQQQQPRQASPKPREKEAEVIKDIRDDETDIWELEAQRETPLPARRGQQQKQQQKQPSSGRRIPSSIQRRGVIPSPWTKKSIHRPAVSRMISQSVPDLSHVSEEPSVLPDDQDAAASSETDEYTLLAQRQQEEEEANKTAQAPASAVKNKKRFDISTFFSSPVAVPGISGQKSMSSIAAAAMSVAPGAANVVPTSSMFPQLPQGAVEVRYDDSSMRSASLSPVRRKQAVVGDALRTQGRRGEEDKAVEGKGKEREHEQEDEEQSQLQKQRQSQQQGYQRQHHHQPHSAPEMVERYSSPTTPERLSVPSASQNQDFTPRPRQTNQSFSQLPSEKRSAAATPPRMQLSRADIHRWTQQTSDASEESSGTQQQSDASEESSGLQEMSEPSEQSSDLQQALQPPLRPLPPKDASPRKSALRSPLKPHTPGRVVDFTSSVLSPAEQVRARHERQNSSFANISFHEQPPDPFSSYSRPVFYPTLDQDHSSSSTNDITMEDAPPLSSLPYTPLYPLSQTTWSRRHWLFLDDLMQYRRRRNFPVRYPRHAEHYLGKTVKSHGTGMTLERWHLDCVDAFKTHVGGWDEGVLAKRLFALMLGEETRRRNSGDLFRL
ncbi:hypothetical protein E4U57_007590 [Claviceps arundinis]|uniref:Involucrin repeat protein n=1 Tax=Claviceps arundinis TaxID=1623583 RepID=A0ABQ7PR23_9HYPO|nr:hypothetical protein E4U57_007590 [Claviceps arundinis]